MTARVHRLNVRRARGNERDVANFLIGGGEMAALIRARDWSQTPLGPISGWPQSLRTAVSLCLASNFPINLIWGPENTQIYNDGYRVVCGAAHPAALGQAYDVTWASAWPAIGEPFARARRGQTSFLENQRMFLTRNGYLEETFFTFSLSPIRDESGEIGGLFHPVTETTQLMLSERRIRGLRDLSTNLATANDLAQLAEKTIQTLAQFEFSVPFVLFYRLADDQQSYQLAASFGVEAGTDCSPVAVPTSAVEPWPFAEAIAGTAILDITGLRDQLRGVVCGPYEEGPHRAVIAPIRAPNLERPPAIVVLGVSPRLSYDDAYRGFYELLVNAIAAAFAVTQARENERRRSAALAEVDRAKTMFFSNVSHEFRTPLTLMLGPIEDVINGDDGLTAGQRERIGMVHRNALRLLKLVNSLLDFSRIEAGRAQARFAPTDLAALTADLASNFRSACERAGLQFAVDCPPLSQPVYVDRDMWEKIVLNLLSNAFKFTLEGRIELSLRETETGAELAVKDSGVGIPTAELPRLFERFHRIEGQRGRTHEGTGIGLSLVQELVGLHDGAISAESVEGAGTTFHVGLRFGFTHLPAEQIVLRPTVVPTDVRSAAYVEEALGWLAAPESVVELPPPAIGSSESAVRSRIVLADDNADMRGYVARILRSQGYEVETVGDGAAALAAARRTPIPDLVLCDVMMPELDGFGLLKAIRADPILQGMLVVMLSARAGEEAKVEGLSAGADDYLVKPFSARELVARVDTAVRLGKQRSEAAARDRAAKVELELRVNERTADLQAVNVKLIAALQERVRSETALARSEAEFRASFEGAAVGKVLVDPATRQILRVNRAFARMLDYQPQELVGLDGTGFTFSEDRELDAFAYARHLAGETDAYYVEKRYIRRDGTLFWVRVCANLIEVEGAVDQSSLVVCTIEDIDARHRAEEGLLAARLNLESVVEQLTTALEQRDILLREVYHRVKNNLQVIDSLLMMQAVRLDDAKAVEALHAMRSRVHALGLVHHQLMGSADLKTFDVAPFLHELSNNILDAHARSAVALSVEASPLSVGLDFAIPIGMLVTELVTNSLKHAFAGGGGKIFVALKPGDDGTVVLTVSDNGVGQRDVVTAAGRSGLGTIIITGLVNQIGGVMNVRSVNGTTTEIRTSMRG